ncbi:MAG: TrkH family potassium uptake protein [Ruminococcaceae bacterium]|nr:TrkH family potassium uptake protein [Oscillospiraceae bacterium]
MNFAMIFSILGTVFLFESLFILLPCIVSLIYAEGIGIDYLIVSILCLLVGLALKRIKPKTKVFYAKEGFITVALSWIFISIMGALPFVVSGEIKSFTDALFETVSGFTTTGATILTDVELLSKTSLFWRSFTHWIGGMGVLVFLLALMPISGGHSFHLMRSESPGPSVGKLVPKVRSTALILYGIYIALSIVNLIFLLIGGMTAYDALVTVFATAGTGGFGIYNDSAASFSPYIQWVITIFMFLYGVNFNFYYMFLIRKPLQGFKITELRYYVGTFIVASLLIFLNINSRFSSSADALRHSAFSVASIMTTTGFATVDFNMWPQFSKSLLVILMFMGACAGSTGGGMKVSRFIIMAKTVRKELFHLLHPSSIKIIKLDGKSIEHDVIRSVNIFLISYMSILMLSFLIISLDNFSFTTNLTAVITTLNNVGPGLDAVGPTGNFSEFSPLSKYVFMFNMFAGRLEIFPMILIFIPHTWKKQ